MRNLPKEKMIEHKDTCPMCNEEFIIRDIKNPEKTCGRQMCVRNYAYRKANYNKRTGYKPKSEDIRKW